MLVALVVGGVALHDPTPSLAFPYSTYLWVWGANEFGELGDNANVASDHPLLTAAFPVGTLVTALGAGDGYTLVGSQSLALDRNHNAWAWGYNNFGEVGDGQAGASFNVYSPVQVCAPDQTAPCTQFLNGITAIAAGGFHSLALDTIGTVWAWGYNFYGELGSPGAYSAVPVPTRFFNGTRVFPTVTAIAAGAYHSVALDNTGTVWEWGSACGLDTGQVPVILSFPEGTSITAIAAGGSHSLALDSGGNVWAWGCNNRGQLGIGTFDAGSNVPTKLTFFPPGTTLTAIAGGGLHSLALDSTGSVWAWGANDQGQLGNTTTIDSHAPASTVFPAGTRIVTIAAGGGHNLAIDADHKVWAWGYNYYGQLGNNGSPTGNQPVVLTTFPAGTRIVSVAAGSYHSLAIESRSFLYGLEAVLDFNALQASPALTPQSFSSAPTTLTSTSTPLAGNQQLVTSTVTDTLGNSLVLDVVQRRDDDHSLAIQWQSLQYNGGAVMTLPANEVAYQWETDGGAIKHLNQHLTLGQGADKTDITANYDPGQNQTKIHVNLPKPQQAQDLTEPGLVVLQTSTTNGTLTFSDGTHSWPR